MPIIAAKRPAPYTGPAPEPPHIRPPLAQLGNATYMRDEGGTGYIVPQDLVAEALRSGWTPLSLGDMAIAGRTGEQFMDLAPGGAPQLGGKALESHKRMTTELAAQAAPYYSAMALTSNPMDHPARTAGEAMSNLLMLATLPYQGGLLKRMGRSAAVTTAAHAGERGGIEPRELTKELMGETVIPEVLGEGTGRAMGALSRGKYEAAIEAIDKALERHLPGIDEKVRRSIVNKIEDHIDDAVSGALGVEEIGKSAFQSAYDRMLGKHQEAPSGR